jgi:hypothetical protein
MDSSRTLQATAIPAHHCGSWCHRTYWQEYKMKFVISLYECFVLGLPPEIELGYL